MNTILIICSVFLVIIAAVVTLYAMKQEEKKIEKYKNEKVSYEEERIRSLEYEENSVSSVVPVQIWTYTIATFATIGFIIFFAIYY